MVSRLVIKWILYGERLRNCIRKYSVFENLMHSRCGTFIFISVNNYMKDFLGISMRLEVVQRRVIDIVSDLPTGSTL